MRSHGFYFSLCLLFSCTSINKPDMALKFPDLTAELLEGGEVTFPDFLKGKKVLIAMVFESWGRYQRPQFQADKWKRFWEEQLKDQGVEFYEIPMMSWGYALGAKSINNAMRGGIPQPEQSKVACYYGQKGRYARLLGIESYRDCYICLIDENGTILSSQSGEITAEKRAQFLNYLP